MSSKSTEHIQTFTARDSSGSTYVIHVYQYVIEIRTLTGTERIRDLKTMRTSDGESVNHESKGRYEIVGHPMIPIFSDDPDAP